MSEHPYLKEKNKNTKYKKYLKKEVRNKSKKQCDKQLLKCIAIKVINKTMRKMNAIFM